MKAKEYGDVYFMPLFEDNHKMKNGFITDVEENVHKIKDLVQEPPLKDIIVSLFTKYQNNKKIPPGL